MADAASFVESAKNGLTQKFAGIPFYVYGGGFVIGFYLWDRNRKAKAAAAAAAAAAGNSSDPSFQDPAILPGGRTASPGAANNPGDSGNDTTKALELWIANGTTYLVALGYDATNANTALRLYASGATVTGAQQRLVSLVISNFGSPPGAVPPKVGQGAGISFDVPNKIAIQMLSDPTKVPQTGHIKYNVIWKDGYGQPITGSLQMQQMTATKVWVTSRTVSVKAGIANVDQQVGTTLQTIQVRYATMPTEIKYLAGTSAPFTYTVVKKGPTPAPKPPGKNIIGGGPARVDPRLVPKYPPNHPIGRAI